VTTDMPPTGDPASPADIPALGPVPQVAGPRPNEALVLRPAEPPANQLDFDDRHDTRATESDDMARRYAALRQDRRRSDWHHLAMGIIVFAVGVTVYLGGFVLVSRLLPNLGPRLVIQVVGIAFAAAGGGVAVRAAGQVLTSRLRGRGRGSKSL
jgi:hypothetical protein